MKFRAVLLQSGKTATGFQVPDAVVAALGAGNRPAVRVTIGTYSYRSTVARLGGAFMLPVSAEVRGAAGVAAGDELEVALELDTEARTVEVPADLQARLDADGEAGRAFAALSYSNRRRIVLDLDAAKTPETRQRRLDKALAQLRGES